MEAPRVFRSPRVLRLLNVLGVGLSLAAITSLLLGKVGVDDPRAAGLVSGLPTFVIGALWALLLRWRATTFGGRIRVGWLLSVPLAALNAGLAASLLFLGERASDERPVRCVLDGLLVGATLGSIIWLPAMVLTLTLFGVPISTAQELAKKGLSGEEDGEKLVGGAVGLLSALSLVVLATQGEEARGATLPEVVGGALRWVYSAGGVGAGAVTVALSHLRERARRRFVEAAERGEVAGYRVEATDEGKVLLRVERQGEGYRDTEYEEALFAIGEGGEAKREVLG